MRGLAESGRTEVAPVRLLARVHAQVGFEIGGRGEAPFAHFALVRFITCVHQVVLLQVGQLNESLAAYDALEWPFA